MKRIGLIAAGLTLLLMAAAPAPDEKDKDKLPGYDKITCDSKILEVPGSGLWKVVKSDFDADKRQVRWLLEAQKDIGEAEYATQNEAWNNMPTAYFFDSDKVRIQTVQVQFEGADTHYKKGERFRVILTLPDEESIMKRAVAVEIRGK